MTTVKKSRAVRNENLAKNSRDSGRERVKVSMARRMAMLQTYKKIK